MAYLIAQGTSREAEATGRELARLPYSRSSFERVGHEVGTLYRRAQTLIEEVLIQEYAVPAEARSVSISIDRVALPMEESIEAPRTTPRARRSTRSGTGGCPRVTCAGCAAGRRAM